MSASKKRKNRQEDEAYQAAAAERQQKLQEEAAAERRSMRLYGIVGVVIAVLAVALVVWNSGFIQRSATAVTVNGEKHTVAEAQFYYNTTRNSMVDYYYSYFGMLPFDYSTSLEDQMYDEENNITWHDYMMEQAAEALATDAALVSAAQAEGYTLSQEGQDTVDATLEELNNAWAVQGYNNLDSFIRANFGTHMTYDTFVELLNRQALASEYSAQYVNSLEYSDADYEAYYKENADLLDTVTVSQFVFQAKVDTKDAEGKDIEMTDEEKAAALDAAKAEQKALAEQVLARLEAGEDPQALADEFKDELYSASVNDARTGASVNSTYSEWALDEARKAGDTTLAEYESSDTAHLYYVARFEDRHLDETLPANVRHVLVAAETDEGASAPTDAQYAEAKAEAEALLKEWDGTEEGFMAMAEEHSADAGSAANGGLIPNITADSGYVDTFSDWALDASRKVGDTGIVQNTGSSTKGWHIMYFAGHADPIWEQTAYNALANEDYSAWLETVTEGFEPEVGSGMKYVEG